MYYRKELEMNLFGFRNSVNLLGCASDKGANDSTTDGWNQMRMYFGTHMFSIKWFLHVSTKWLTSRPKSNSGHHLSGHLSLSVPRQTASCSLCRMSLPWIPKGSSDLWTGRDQHQESWNNWIWGYGERHSYLCYQDISSCSKTYLRSMNLGTTGYVLIMGVDVLPQYKWVLIMGVDDQ